MNVYRLELPTIARIKKVIKGADQQDATNQLIELSCYFRALADKYLRIVDDLNIPNLYVSDRGFMEVEVEDSRAFVAWNDLVRTGAVSFLSEGDDDDEEDEDDEFEDDEDDEDDDLDDDDDDDGDEDEEDDEEVLTSELQRQSALLTKTLGNIADIADSLTKEVRSVAPYLRKERRTEDAVPAPKDPIFGLVCQGFGPNDSEARRTFIEVLPSGLPQNPIEVSIGFEGVAKVGLLFTPWHVKELCSALKREATKFEE
jgi:hypothetical protein